MLSPELLQRINKELRPHFPDRGTRENLGNAISRAVIFAAKSLDVKPKDIEESIAQKIIDITTERKNALGKNEVRLEDANSWAQECQNAVDQFIRRYKEEKENKKMAPLAMKSSKELEALFKPITSSLKKELGSLSQELVNKNNDLPKQARDDRELKKDIIWKLQQSIQKLQEKEIKSTSDLQSIKLQIAGMREMIENKRALIKSDRTVQQSIKEYFSNAAKAPLSYFASMIKRSPIFSTSKILSRTDELLEKYNRQIDKIIAEENKAASKKSRPK